MTDLSVDARLLASERGTAPPINTSVVLAASAVLAAGAIALASAYSWRQGALFLVGGALGVTLYHALFGFTSAWRVFIANGRGAGLRPGDIIVRLDGAPITGADDLVRALTGDKIGRDVALEVLRGTGLLTLSLVPQERRRAA